MLTNPDMASMPQDRDASLKRLRAVAKTTAEKASKEKAAAAAQPLESSQRAVIRDLSLRVANLTRGNNQLKEERERAQVLLMSACPCDCYDGFQSQVAQTT